MFARVPAPLETALAALLGLGLGLSPAFGGLFDTGDWGVAGLALLVLLLAVAAAGPARLTTAALVAFAGLLALWLWSLASIGWAESAGQALTEANRWLVYAALFATFVLLLRDDRLGRVAIGAAVAGVLGIAGYVVVRLLAGTGPDLFTAGRLGFPLGYTNGQAGHLLLAFWPLVAVAETARRPALRGLALAGATALAGIVLLAQSRAALVALVASALLLVALAPGRGARFWALVVAGGALGLALAVEPFASLPVTSVAPPSADTLQDAGLAVLAAATLAGLAWAVGVPGVAALARRRPGAADWAGFAAPIVVVAILAVGGLAALGDPVDQVRDEYDAFRQLETPGEGGNRVLSGGGNRHDYWRIALDQFSSEPLQGIGAGNYDSTYFVERKTTENITQPHSIELQLMGELGLVGLAALALFVAGVLAGLAARARRGRSSPSELGLVVAAGGTFTVWLVHTSFDWLHLIPGVTGVALVAAAVAVGSGSAEARVRLPRWASVGAAVALVLAAGFTLGPAVRAEHHRTEATDALREDPRRALEQARDALGLDDESLGGYYVGAAAQARLGDYRGAVATLREAARREPHDFVTYALLGDLATRRGERQAARRWYARASALNPRSTELAARARGEPPPP